MPDFVEQTLPCSRGMDVSKNRDAQLQKQPNRILGELWGLLTDETSGQGLLRDTEGAVYVEYVTILLYVSIGAAAATLTLAAPLFSLYKFSQAVLIVPFP